MARTLHNSVTVSLHSQAHTWRRDLAQLERRHGKQYKAARAALQKKSETLGIMLMKTEIMNSFMLWGISFCLLDIQKDFV